MQSFRLDREVLLARDLDEVFDFFGAPANLERITPPWLRFRVLAVRPPDADVAARARPDDGALRVGTQIDYRLALHGVGVRWTSLISRWEAPRVFVDEQIRGPYTRWVHTHRFEACAGGTRMRDTVEYAVPGGWLVDRLFVRRELRRIFDYRAQWLCKRFDGVEVEASEAHSKAEGGTQRSRRDSTRRRLAPRSE